MPAPDAKHHMQNRNWFETILHYIPGFRGYLQKENRRESDELQRNWLAGRLQSSKRGLNDYARMLTDAGNLDALAHVERVRQRLDKLINRITSAMQGYSGVFDLVRVREDVLDRVYAHDASLIEDVNALAEAVEKLPTRPDPPATLAAQLLKMIDDLDEAWDQRDDILKGME
jgi:hypothetical protein